jgi:hypothetical protein
MAVWLSWRAVARVSTWLHLVVLAHARWLRYSPQCNGCLPCGLCDAADVAMRLQTSPATKVLATYLRCPRSWDKARVMQHVLSVGGPTAACTVRGPTAACTVDFVTDVSPGPAPAVAPNVTPVPAAAPAVTLVPLAPLLAATAAQAFPVAPPASSACLPSPTSVSPVSSQCMGTSTPLQAARVGRVAGDLDGLSESVKAVVAHSAVAGRVRDVVASRTLGMQSGGISASDIGGFYNQLYIAEVRADILLDPDTSTICELADLLRCLPDVVEELSTSSGALLYRVVGYGGAGGGAGAAAGPGGDHVLPAAGALGSVLAPQASAPLWQVAWIRLRMVGVEGKPIYVSLVAAPGVEHDGVVVKFFRTVCRAMQTALLWQYGCVCEHLRSLDGCGTADNAADAGMWLV